MFIEKHVGKESFSFPESLLSEYVGKRTRKNI